MKILMLTPYVTITSRPEFSRNKTGFGYMVYDIAKAVAKTEQVDVLCTDTRGSGFVQDYVAFLARDWWKMISSIFRCVPLSLVLNLKREYGMSRGAFVRLLYYWLLSGYVRQIVKVGGYDVVHVHGCGFSGTIWDAICRDCGVKIVYTLHGLNSFSDTVRMEPAGKRYERDFLKEVVEGRHQISVISSGMKKIILSCYSAEKCDNIVVINNSFIFGEGGGNDLNINVIYGIPGSAKIILYVGNVSGNKNQQALVKAFPVVEKSLREKSWVLFLGKYDASDPLVSLIEHSKYRNHLVLCGEVDKALVSEYYSQADAVVLLSVAEGFGLSLIEGMHFGLPCMMPTDLDAYEDIYDPCAVVAAPDRTEKTVSEGLTELLTKEWDKEAIKEYSRKFDGQAMANKYKQFYTF